MQGSSDAAMACRVEMDYFATCRLELRAASGAIQSLCTDSRITRLDQCMSRHQIGTSSLELRTRNVASRPPPWRCGLFFLRCRSQSWSPPRRREGGGGDLGDVHVLEVSCFRWFANHGPLFASFGGVLGFGACGGVIQSAVTDVCPWSAAQELDVMFFLCGGRTIALFMFRFGMPNSASLHVFDFFSLI